MPHDSITPIVSRTANPCSWAGRTRRPRSGVRDGAGLRDRPRWVGIDLATGAERPPGNPSGRTAWATLDPVLPAVNLPRIEDLSPTRIHLLEHLAVGTVSTLGSTGRPTGRSGRTGDGTRAPRAAAGPEIAPLPFTPSSGPAR